MHQSVMVQKQKRSLFFPQKKITVPALLDIKEATGKNNSFILTSHQKKCHYSKYPTTPLEISIPQDSIKDEDIPLGKHSSFKHQQLKMFNNIFFFAVLVAVYVLVGEACLITNCPRGGKRSGKIAARADVRPVRNFSICLKCLIFQFWFEKSVRFADVEFVVKINCVRPSGDFVT